MRLLVAVLAVLVGGSHVQAQASLERVASQGRISTGASTGGFSSFERGSTDPCRPTPCGPNTRCEVNPSGIALCRCIEGYVPDGHTINGCKPQCTVNDDCPDDYRCRANQCVRVCVTGACGLNADCTARNHVAQCRCPPRYRGDAHISCSLEEPESKAAPPAPYVSPCAREPCGINANCREEGERPVCSCPVGYEGNPLQQCIRGECIDSDDCPDYQACKGLRCIDPCSLELCARNAECVTRNHQPVCSCGRGMVGDPFEGCRRFLPEELCNPSPCGRNTKCEVSGDRAKCSCITNYIGNPLQECRPECVSDSECPHNMACRNNICVNPCVKACGENAYCDVRNARAVCSCPEHYQGDPYSRCYAECTSHDECGSTRACVRLRCVDPCIGACGIGADCKVSRHQAICSCPKTHTGDPFKSCRAFTREDHCNPNPCGTNAECTPGYDKDGNDRAVCTCPRYYIGNPLISCQKGECETNDQCPRNQACYLYECKSPCFTLEGDSVCGENAQCNVKEHQPVCSCPSGYNGDPRHGCYIGASGSTGGRFASSRFTAGRAK
ncbi:sushi, nidogen and EGF-like domain-containing protein 1 isoform X2 [Eriocheir sinensis]|uniref:sushi, nidogen and EGF-like domain-containing protein 1 isoform X2 n=1 Tax=Eriocheir sinensis TaxID=95602 RepID=UPI0021C8302F|nr:sushi, nidogen and EGF-like domain-containing protein 1 isoform X2 [Eriocheir sinensis]